MAGSTEAEANTTPPPTYASILSLNRSTYNMLVTIPSGKDTLDKQIKGVMVESIGEEENNLLKIVNNEAKIKLLQMYFDAYMAPMNSDIRWRLGAVVSTAIETTTLNDPYKVRNG
jgi:hypothetical protein